MAQGAKPWSLPLKTELLEGTVTQDRPQHGGRGGRSFTCGSEEAQGWGLILPAPQTIYTAGEGLRRVPKALQQQEKSGKILSESGERPLLGEETLPWHTGPRGPPDPGPKRESRRGGREGSVTQCSPPAQRSGEPGPSPALEWEQQPPGEARLRLLLYLCQHSPSSAPEGSGRQNKAARA